MIDGERRLSESLIEEHAGELILSHLAGARCVHLRFELLHERGGAQRSRTQEVEQRAEEQIEKPEPSHAEVLDDAPQSVESLETFVILSDESRVVTEEYEPAGPAKRRQLALVEEWRDLADDCPGVAQVAGEAKVLEELRGGIGLESGRHRVIDSGRS